MNVIARAIVVFAGRLSWSGGALCRNSSSVAAGNRFGAEMSTWGGMAVTAIGVWSFLAASNSKE
jgi:hypothetical protein